MAFDFKKEYREFYLPKQKPEIVDVPETRYIAVEGRGDPNAEAGEYQRSIGVLYALAYAVKMSKMGDCCFEGYFDFVVPPLEGFWWQEGVSGVDYTRKDDFRWISCIRMPDFVTSEVFERVRTQTQQKKKIDCSTARLITVQEGLCVQIMHVGPYDDEPASVARMDAYLRENGCATDFSEKRRHHEIYLSDARKVPPERRKTVIRHPIRRVTEE